jgi:hypothetical protein
LDEGERVEAAVSYAMAGWGVACVRGVRAVEEGIQDVGGSETFCSFLRAAVVDCAGDAEEVVGEGVVDTGEEEELVRQV